MKLRDIVSSRFDVRDFMSVDMNDDVKEEKADNLDLNETDVDYILRHAEIYVNGAEFDSKIPLPDEDLENLSDIKELLECALYQPSSSSEIEGNTQAALDLVNKMIGEWSN